MPLEPEHELHKRRLGRNLGLGLSLLLFVVVIFGVTIVKVEDAPNPGKAASQFLGGN